LLVPPSHLFRSSQPTDIHSKLGVNIHVCCTTI